jgi:hypothetical protein
MRSCDDSTGHGISRHRPVHFQYLGHHANACRRFCRRPLDWSGRQGSPGGIVARTGSFFLAFVAASAYIFIASSVCLFVIGPIQPLFWREQGARAAL